MKTTIKEMLEMRVLKNSKGVFDDPKFLLIHVNRDYLIKINDENVYSFEGEDGDIYVFNTSSERIKLPVLSLDSEVEMFISQNV